MPCKPPYTPVFEDHRASHSSNLSTPAITFTSFTALKLPAPDHGECRPPGLRGSSEDSNLDQAFLPSLRSVASPCSRVCQGPENTCEFGTPKVNEAVKKAEGHLRNTRPHAERVFTSEFHSGRPEPAMQDVPRLHSAQALRTVRLGQNPSVSHGSRPVGPCACTRLSFRRCTRPYLSGPVERYQDILQGNVSVAWHPEE